MNPITTEIWSEGPDHLGRWRGRWRLNRDGLALQRRFGATSTSFASKEAAHAAASMMAKADKRNVADIAVLAGADTSLSHSVECNPSRHLREEETDAVTVHCCGSPLTHG
jgi:hypothetical protein